jgi:hypothetical protein
MTSKEYLAHYKKGPILIALEPTKLGKGDDILDVNILGNLLKTGATKKSNVFIVEYSGKIIENPKDVLIENPADAAQEFASSNAIVFFIYGNRIDIFFRTQLIDCIPDIQSHDAAVKIGTAALRIKNYRDIIDQHHSEKVYKKNLLGYWKSKSERILVASPENKFANDLAYYLDQYVADGRVDQECQTRWTDDRTDIRVVRYLDKKIYIFEVKWLGKSEKSSYDGNNALMRINAGMVQLVEYMQAENQSICGALVIYDARKQKIQVKWDAKIQKQDARIDDPIRYYLDLIQEWFYN